MADKTLTAANSILMLSISGLYSVPQRLQGFETDDLYGNEASETGETKMGVDGKLSFGWTASPTVVEYVLQADSNSMQIFEDWDTAEKSAKEKLVAQGLIRLPSVGRSYVLTKGILTRVPRLPSAGKLLKSRRFSVTWESCTPASI